MNLKEAVEAVLQEQEKSLGWLATKMDRTLEGLKLSLANETIKYSDLKKLISILNVPIQSLFVGDNTVQNQIGGKHNVQASHSSVAGGNAEYSKMEVDGLLKQISLLESRLSDKEHIIELLRNK